MASALSRASLFAREDEESGDHFTDLVGGDNALSTVKLLLEHNADVNATVERAKDEPLDSCDGSR